MPSFPRPTSTSNVAWGSSFRRRGRHLILMDLQLPDGFRLELDLFQPSVRAGLARAPLLSVAVV